MKLAILLSTLLVSFSAYAFYTATATNALGETFTASGATRDDAENKALESCRQQSHAASTWGKTCRISHVSN